MRTTTKQEEMSLFRISATKVWVVASTVASLSGVVEVLPSLLGQENSWLHWLCIPFVLLAPFLLPISLAAIFLTRDTPFTRKWKITLLVLNVLGALISLGLIAVFIWLNVAVLDE